MSPAQTATAATVDCSVAAVIVTRNRLALLQQCVAAIRTQSRRPDEIIIVDNDSSDGTSDWLNAQADVFSIHQENLGSGGGQYAGIQAAYARGHDWIWCMDDDGWAAPDCLQQLLAPKNSDLYFRSPLVLDQQDNDKLAFRLLHPGQGEPLRTRNDVEREAKNGLLWGDVSLFLGILIHRNVVTRIGLPIAELFLWGEEIEYMLRAKRYGFLLATVVGAHFYHPQDRMTWHTCHFLGRSFSVAYVGDPLKDYLIVRNTAFFRRQHYGWFSAVKCAAKFALFHLQNGEPIRAIRAVRYAVEGACGRLNGHRAFLHH